MPLGLPWMSCRTRIVSASAAFVLLGCGKSTGNAEPAADSSGETSSSAVGSEGGRGGSGSVEDASSTENINSGGCGGTSSGDSTGGETMTSSLEATSSTGNEGGAFASGGASAMTAEEAGCIVTGPALSQCPGWSQGELTFTCPLEQPTPDTCSECYEPGIDPQGHPINQCNSAELPDGSGCKSCCCTPTRSGCQERESISGCGPHPDMPRYVMCVKPYDEPSGCTLSLYGDLLDTYCCP
jgi:hypothetical protein